MSKKWIALIILILLLGAGVLIIYDNLRAEETGNAFYTDGPGENAGKSTIDGEVFIIEEGDPNFNR